MEKFELLTEVSLWFVPLCMLLGALYAWALYSKKHVWSKTVNYVLAGARFLLVTLLAFLLLVPLIRQLKNYLEDPIIVLATDNSQSMKNTEASLKKSLNLLETTLTEGGYLVEHLTFSEGDTLELDASKSNLGGLLKNVSSLYENRNLQQVVLLSDGIHNSGLSPDLIEYGLSINTLGFGDTSVQNDISILDIDHNKIAYTNNQFPIKVDVQQTGFAGKEVDVRLMEGGKLMAKRTVPLKGPIQSCEFLVEASTSGKHRYTVDITPLEGEHSTKNNVRDIYIDIVDGKQRILIYALGPHPDIKAIKSSIYEKENFAVDVVYASDNKEPQNKYDLIILHQIPNTSNKGAAILSKLLERKTNFWFICGNRSDYRKLNEIQKTVSFTASRQIENAFVSYNADFNKISLEKEEQAIVQDYQPVDYPLADVDINPGADVILFQRIGSITTQKPVLFINEGVEDKKVAFFIGDGLWGWRLQEFARHNNTNVFDQLLNKLLQYITTKKDSRKLKVNPIKDEFNTSESIVFKAEVYNDIYENIYDQEIKLSIKGEDGINKTYAFVNAENNSKFNLGDFEKGLYSYTATVTGKPDLYASGQFSVKEFYLEDAISRADHELLKRIAKKAGGGFYSAADLSKLTAELLSREHKQKVIFSDEIFLELINMKWLFFVLMALATLEWALRKYQGGY